MRIVFIGTAQFACPALLALADHHEIPLVVTQPDRPIGRHAVLQPPPVKEEALRLGVPVFQPEQINQEDSIRRLQTITPDLLVVAAYGQLLKPNLFTLAPLGTVNIHASLLPAYRGAAPANWAIIRGEKTTGITTFLIDAGMDTGDLLHQRAIDIAPNETAGELVERLGTLGASVILETVEALHAQTVIPTSQPREGASMAPMLSRSDGRIHWESPAQSIHNLVRGMQPWPSTWTLLEGRRVKIHRTRMTNITCGTITPGEIALRETDRLLVGAPDRMIEICEIQREGRPRSTGSDFLHGLRGPATFD